MSNNYSTFVHLMYVFFQYIHNCHCCIFVKISCRLISKNDRCFRCQCTSNRYTLLLSARKL